MCNYPSLLALTLLHSCRFHGTSWKRALVAVLDSVETHSYHKLMSLDSPQSWSQLLMQQSCRNHLPKPISWHTYTICSQDHDRIAWMIIMHENLIFEHIYDRNQKEIPVPSIPSWSVISSLTIPSTHRKINIKILSNNIKLARHFNRLWNFFIFFGRLIYLSLLGWWVIPRQDPPKHSINPLRVLMNA
jgi:hypothetical protein